MAQRNSAVKTENPLASLEALVKGEICLPDDGAQRTLLGLVVTEATAKRITGHNREPIYSWKQKSVEAYVFDSQFREQLVERVALFGVIIPFGFQGSYAAGNENQVADDILERIEGLNPQEAKYFYTSRPPYALWIGRWFSLKEIGEDGDRMTLVSTAYAAKFPARAPLQTYQAQTA